MMANKKRTQIYTILSIPGILAGNRYLQHDSFADTKAAGEINATICVPGPGVRSVTDTENKLSLSGGALVCAGGKASPGSGDPGIWLSNLTRAPGRMTICELTTADTSHGMGIGLDTIARTGNVTEGFSITSTGYIRPYEGGGVKNSCNLLSYAATSYKFAVVLRSAGQYLLMSGGALTYWTLLWICKDSVVTTLVPCICGYSSAFTSSYIRVPKGFWLPIPLAYDSFTRSNGGMNGSSTETTGPDGQAVAARTWVDQVGTLKVSGNVATVLALSGGVAIGTVDATNANIFMQAALTVAGGYSGFVLRYVDANNYVVAYHDGTNAYLGKVVSGTPTALINSAAAYSAGATQVVVASGTSFELFYNDAKIGATQTIADAVLQSGTKHGLIFTDTSNTVDNLVIFPRGDGDEHSALDQYSS